MRNQTVSSFRRSIVQRDRIPDEPGDGGSDHEPNLRDDARRRIQQLHQNLLPGEDQARSTADQRASHDQIQQQTPLVTPRLSNVHPDSDRSAIEAQNKLHSNSTDTDERRTGSDKPDSSDSASDSSNSRPVRRRQQETRSSVFGRIYWLMATAGILFLVWKAGPAIVEEYYFAAERGKIRAEYSNAVEQLEGDPLGSLSQAYQLVADKVRPSVVSINTVRPDEGTRGQGSGVVMTNDGYILTNSHVVANSTQINVALSNRHSYRAELIGTDPESDLAVIRIDAPGLIPAEWGDSDHLKVGSIVWAIGSPYGLDQTVTSGIISGKNRRDEEHVNRELLQTDAAVNPGNSGGPLVDSMGNVVGINTSIFGDTFQGISFAVPSTVARFVFSEIRKNGKVTRGYLGVRPRAVFQTVAAELKLPDLDGALVRYVEPDSPAYRSGLRSRDVIREWNGQPLNEFTNLFRFVEMTPPNETVPVLVVRDGQPQMLDVTVGERANIAAVVDE